MVGKIPLWSKDRRVVGWATVDEEDFYDAYGYRWSLSPTGYAVRSVWVKGGGGRRYTVSLHRALLGLGVGDGGEVDHINRDRLDNRRANLRLVTGPQNKQNVSKRSGTSSRYRGVYLNRKSGKWVASVYLAGEFNYLGVFKDEDEAGLVAQQFREANMSHAID